MVGKALSGGGKAVCKVGNGQLLCGAGRPLVFPGVMRRVFNGRVGGYRRVFHRFPGSLNKGVRAPGAGAPPAALAAYVRGVGRGL